MRGIPKSLNSKADYIFVHGEALAGRVDKMDARKIFEALDNQRETYFFDKVVKSTTVAPKKGVILKQKNSDREVKYHQFIKQADPNATLYKLGFTDIELNELIAQLEV